MGEVTLGLVPNQGDEATREAVDAFCAWIADKTALKVRAVCTPSPGELASLMAAGQVQFAWVSPTLLFTEPRLADVDPLLSAKRGDATAFHSIVYCAADSPIQQLSDVAGVDMAWVAPTSASGYLVPRLKLSGLIDFANAFDSEGFYGSHGAVADAVLSGEASLGASFAGFEGHGDERRLVRASYVASHGLEAARVLLTAGPIPADMMVVRPDVDDPTRRLWSDALCAISADPRGAKPLRRITGADGFVPVTDETVSELQGLVSLCHGARPI